MRERLERQDVKKARQTPGLFVGGLERIRTAVAAFAELSLATRPPDLLYPHLSGEANIRQTFGRVSLRLLFVL